MSVTKPGSLSSWATLHLGTMTLLIRRLFSWQTGTWKRGNIKHAQGSVNGGKDEEQASDLPCFLTGAGNAGGSRGPPSPSLAHSTVYRVLWAGSMFPGAAWSFCWIPLASFPTGSCTGQSAHLVSQTPGSSESLWSLWRSFSGRTACRTHL